MSNDEKRTFEQALTELETHVRRLDGGELPLEESLSTFEAGVKLIRECSELLDDAEQRITELSASAAASAASGDGAQG
jgi:exodeoxyribonuclease VII small subunit